MFAHPVIDRAPHALPLDGLGAVLFAIAFAVVAITMWRRPAYAIGLLVMCVPFAFARHIGPTTLTLPKIALLGAIAGLALRRTSLAPLRVGATRTLALCGSAVLLATALSIWHANDRGAALRETLKALEYLSLFATIALAARADDDERTVGATIVATMGVVCVLALVQEITGAPSGIWFFGHTIPRIAGPLEGPNQLAGYLSIALALTFALALARVPAPGTLAAIGLGLATLVLTLSRTGIASTLLGLGAVAAYAQRRLSRRTLLVSALGVIAGVAVLAAWGASLGLGHAGTAAVLGHLSSVAESPDPGRVGDRSQLWHAAFVLWRAHPFFGIGAGNYENELALAGYPQLHTHANSLYLQALVEGGIPLFLATLALVAASILAFVRGPLRDAFVLGALGASVALASHQLLDFLVFYPKVGDLWWIALALGAARKDGARASAR